jgi:hypothetical protein
MDAFLAQCAPLVADLARSRLDRNEALVVRRRSDATANVDMPYALTLGAAARLSAACGADVERFFGEPVMHFVDSLAVEWRSDHHAGSGCEIVRVRDANLMDAKSNPRLFDLTYMQPAFLDGTAERREVCNDAFAVHIFNERFANDMVELGESHGNWTQEPTDSYPTEDIQLDEIKWEDQWESILERRIVPLMEELYEGTSWDMLFEPFLVRYIMTGQYELEPHQDTSKVTSVVTLVESVRRRWCAIPAHNCTFISKTLGLTLFHPGLVTHQHTGLPITAGRRYIFVSFNQ